MPNQAWYDSLKKGFNPDGTVNKSFTYSMNGKDTYADGSPAPNAGERLATQLAEGNKRSLDQGTKMFNDAWAAYGGHPGMGQYGPTPGYVDKGDGSDAWKYSQYLSPYGMKNPVYIKGPVGTGGFFDRGLPTKTPAGAEPPIPSVQDRMTRMGQAVQKGIDKGSIGANQMQDKFKYQVPGTSPANPVTKPVAAPKTNTLAGMTRLT
jgi:hypothetical protein